MTSEVVSARAVCDATCEEKSFHTYFSDVLVVPNPFLVQYFTWGCSFQPRCLFFINCNYPFWYLYRKQAPVVHALSVQVYPNLDYLDEIIKNI